MANHHFPSDHRYTLDARKETLQIFADHLKLGGASPQGDTIAFTNYYMTYNGRAHIPVMGEFHFSRFPRAYWLQELQKMRAGGVQIVGTYIFWIQIEEDEGVFDWSGNNDVRAFLDVCQEAGMQVVLRIGPFAHGECRNGGLPDWLYGRPFQVRSNDEGYLAYVRRYYEQIGTQVAGYFFQDGGPIIGIQLDNEYMHCGAPWEVTYRQGKEWVPAGSDGDAYMLKLKELAQAAGLETTFYSCTAWLGSPVPKHEFLPMQGGYAFMPWSPDPEYRQEPTREYLFRNRHAQPLHTGEVTYTATDYPYASCELGGGIQITYHHRPIVPPESVQGMAVVALGGGANLLGYYMYHGGSQAVGKHAYLNEFTVPRISYDFQAPIREYGQLNQSYHRLRALHLFLQDFGETLAPMAVALPEHAEQITPENTSTLRYSVRSKDGSGFLFLNNYQDHVEMQDHEGVHFSLELPGETLNFPQRQDLTIRKNISAILPFNLPLDDEVLLKYATAQLLTTIGTAEQTTYVSFAPEGMHAEFAFDKATYQAIEVTGGTFMEEQEVGYVLANPGTHCCIHISTHNGTKVQLLVLTQEQADRAWKVQLWGQERLILTDALVLCQEQDLHLSWRGQDSISLAVYPPVHEPIAPARGLLTQAEDSFFTQYLLTLPVYTADVSVQQLNGDTIRVAIPSTALDGVDDVFISVDYLGDMGNAYLDGKLVSDHFANGLPWEIGLKRFVLPGEDREMFLHLTPLQENAAALRYFPTGMAFRPSSDGVTPIEVRSMIIHPEYHGILAQSVEREVLDRSL